MPNRRRDRDAAAILPGAAAPNPRRKPGSRKPKRVRSAAPKSRQGWLTPAPIPQASLGALGIPEFCYDLASGGEGTNNIPAAVHYVEEPGNPLGGGLAASWLCSVAWLNPPYGSPYLWCERAAAAVESGEAGMIIGLLPVRPDAAWHRDNIAGRAHLLLLGRRVRFEVAPNVPGGSPTFSCQLVIWGGTRAQVEALRVAFPEADFRPAPSWWGGPTPPRPQGSARNRALATARLLRGGGSRARTAQGGR